MTKIWQQQAKWALSEDILCDLSDYGLIQCAGNKAKDFLQGQLTCDMENISEQLSSLACYCDQKGRMLASFRVLQVADNYLLILPKSMVATTIAELKKFAAFSKVEVTDASEKFLQIGVSGPNICDYFPNSPKQMNEVNGENNLFLIKIPGDFPRFHVFGDINLIKDTKEKLSNKCHLVAFNAWQLLDIQQQIPTILPETKGLFLPHHLNFQHLGISFKKGCYRGQEIIARMEYLGKLKQHLYGAHSEKVFKAGDSLVNSEEKSVGHIVNSALDHQGNYQLLVTVLDRAKDNRDVKGIDF